MGDRVVKMVFLGYGKIIGFSKKLNHKKIKKYFMGLERNNISKKCSKF